MPVNNTDRNKEAERKNNPSESTEDQQHKGSGFNEKPVGRQPSTTFSEGSPNQNPGEEDDILSGPNRKSAPQPDADV